jgi:4-hydroxy-2-oxoheptanedioate aldolase
MAFERGARTAGANRKRINKEKERIRMRNNHVKQKIIRGTPTLGAWLALPAVPVARYMAGLGFDWLTIDMEHSAIDVPTMAQMITAIAETGTCAPLVRVPACSVEWFKWALDAGAWGIIVPMVETRAQAEQAARFMRYPPQGTRSIGGAFFQRSFAATRAEYAAAANDELLLMVQLESRTALENLDDILTVPGLDLAFVGPYDLSSQLGLPPSDSSTAPEFLAALDRIQQAAQQHQVPLGIYCSSGAGAAQRIREGFVLVSTTNDTAALATGADAHLAQALQGIGDRGAGGG